jgi:hypothetical protein
MTSDTLVTLKTFGIIGAIVAVTGALCFLGGLKYGTVKATAAVQEKLDQAAEAKGAEDAIKNGQIKAAEASQAAALIQVKLADESRLATGRTVEALKAKLASLQHGTGADGAGDSGSELLPGSGGALANLVQPAQLEAQLRVSTQIIAAMDIQHAADLGGIKARDEQITAQLSQIDGLNKALKLADTRADLFEQAMKLQKRGSGWSVSGGYGTDKSLTAGVEKGIAGPVSAGVDIVRRVLPGGNSTVEVMGHLRWSF